MILMKIAKSGRECVVIQNRTIVKIMRKTILEYGSLLPMHYRNCRNLVINDNSDIVCELNDDCRKMYESMRRFLSKLLYNNKRIIDYSND